jgi:hypothetical protein
MVAMPLLVYAVVHREGRFWVIDVPSAGTVTQAYRWEDIRSMARDCAAVMLDIPVRRVGIGAVRLAPQPDWRSW